MALLSIAPILRRDAPRLTPDMPLRAAAAILVGQRTAAAPVVDGTGALVGVLSQKDCFRAALNASYYQQWQGTVADYMTGSVRTLPADTDLVTAAEAFLAEPFRSFPVLEDGRLAGMLHRSDLLRAFLDRG